MLEASDDGELTQIEVWNAYKEEMSSLHEAGEAQWQPASALIRQVSLVFPRSSAMSIPAGPGQPQRFILQGLDTRDRSQRLKTECQWTSCEAPETTKQETARAHAIAHAQLATDGRCRWSHCQHVVSRKGRSLDEQRRILKAHVLTHLPSESHSTAGKEGQAEAQGLAVPTSPESVSNGQDAERLVPVKSDPSLIEPFTMHSGARAIRGKEGALDMTGLQLNAPPKPKSGKQTLDDPGLLTFTVARTPLDANENGTGCAAAAALILRSLARTAATMLDRAGLRPEILYGEDEAAALAAERRKKATEPGKEEKFGLPLPPGDAADVGNAGTIASGARKTGGEQSGAAASVAVGAEGAAAAGGSASTPAPARAAEAPTAVPALTGADGIGPAEDWAQQAALRLVDALVSVEDEMMMQSSENDVLSRMLNDALVELRPQKVPGVFSEQQEGEGEGEERMQM